MTKRALIVTACLLATSLSGCAAFGWKSDGEKDDRPEWLTNLKALEGSGGSTGISREARAIEKSLGTP